MTAGSVFFITGTDTNAGKTVLTALLLAHLRGEGRNAVALKPFASGGREDARLFHELQPGSLTLDEINPFHFTRPLAPLIGMRLESRPVSLETTLAHIRTQSARFPIVLVEGAGGLLSPLGEDYSSLDLIKRLDCPVLVAAPDRLGVVNQVRLVFEVLRGHGQGKANAVLRQDAAPDESCRYNLDLIREFVPECHLLPFIGSSAQSAAGIRQAAGGLSHLLRQLLGGF